MLQILIVAVIFSLVIVGFGLALHFSKYKQGDAGCCGGGNCSTDKSSHTHSSCYSSKIDFLKKIDTKKMS